MEGKVAVLGDADFVMPFSTLGLDTFTVRETAEDAIANARKIIENKYALVVVAENIAPMTEEIFSTQVNLPTPAVVIVPFTTESKGFAIQSLAKVLKMATGTNVLQNN